MSGNFYQVDNVIPQEKLKVIGPIAFSIFSFLASMTDVSGKCFPSIDYIADKTGISRRSVINAIKILKQENMLIVSNHNRHSNLYKLFKSANNTLLPGEKVHEVHHESANNAPLKVHEVHPNNNHSNNNQFNNIPPAEKAKKTNALDPNDSLFNQLKEIFNEPKLTLTENRYNSLTKLRRSKQPHEIIKAAQVQARDPAALPAMLRVDYLIDFFKGEDRVDNLLNGKNAMPQTKQKYNFANVANGT